MIRPAKSHEHPAKTPKLGHPLSLISLHCPVKKAWVLSYPLSTQNGLGSDWVDQADLSLCWVHRPFCWFCPCREVLQDDLIVTRFMQHVCTEDVQCTQYFPSGMRIYMHGCRYVMQLAAYNFGAFEYDAKNITHPHIRIHLLSTVWFWYFLYLHSSPYIWVPSFILSQSWCYCWRKDLFLPCKSP